jgi:hypothetical protein
MLRRVRVAALLLPVALGCSAIPGVDDGGTGPEPGNSIVRQDSLSFLRADPAAPPLADRLMSFWAVRGKTREIRLMYRPRAGAPDSVEFARFRVDARSLINDSAGNPIAQGDSVLITVGVADTLGLITEFQPAGLVFSAAQPARLWLKFGEADDDLNDDGSVNAADTTALHSLAIWKQEHAGEPWSRLPSTVDTRAQDVEAAIPGFTRFAVAY